MQPRDAAWYVVAQILGAIVAASLIWIIAMGAPGGYDSSAGGLAANGYGPHSPAGYDVRSAFLVEVLVTFLLVYTALGATDIATPAGFAGIAIGLVLTAAHLVAIPVTNASVNPARSIGPAVLVGGWAVGQLWLFVAAPLIGGIIAAAAYLSVRPAALRISAREAERALPHEERERAA